MESKVYYAMSFYNTTDTMQTEKKAREQFEIHIMPTPRAISTSCGLAIRFEGVDEQAYLQFALQQQVPLGLYRIEMKEDGEPKQRVFLFGNRKSARIVRLISLRNKILLF